ncbi:MAG: flagellar hook-associated protein FlgK, partial [Vicinamibacterales bacterium]|nr:flagellar hook-associated protein FlgK [Vicinamibacterales bacterium]
MSGLLGSLSAASRALDAQRYGLEVTGQNMANVNTAGYARREVMLTPTAVSGSLDGYGGVDIVGVRATRDRLLERRLLMEKPAEQREQVIADALKVVDVMVGLPGKSLDSTLDTFFNWASQLAADPTSTTLRHEFVSAGERLAGGFRQMVDRLTAARRDADANIRSGVDEANRLGAQIASLNAGIAGLSGVQATNEGLLDKQRVLIDQLAGVIDIDVIARADGGVDITTTSGRALVIGATPYALTAQSAPPDGYADVTYDGRSITADITGGKLGGYIQVRDTLVPGYLDELDALATALVVEVNQIHQNGYDATGVAGEAFFTMTAGTPAASIAVNAAISANPGKVAAAGSPISGDNENARVLAALRDGNVLSGGTLNDAWARFVYRVGSDVQGAEQEQASRQDIVRQIDALREAVSGV